MRDIGLHEIRKEFINFFKQKGHLALPSFSLVPKNDKSLLLINAGMAPLKPYFTGEKVPPRKRVTTCQKCIRTADIDNVGKTARHATFFEMLGNFSFGDYFKKEAIEWAWEFLTEVLEIPEKDLWVSIYEKDDEAHEIWNKIIGIPEEKIVRLGKNDNFWELEVGPCGPCSEIYVDRGEKYGCGKETCIPGCDCDRFIEVWNLVFTQFDKDEKGNYKPLQNPNIDTGMGLERIATVMEKVDNIFEVKEIKKILKSIEKESGKNYGKDEKTDIAIRVITDHSRAMTFLVSDGVLPSNEGRGYVLRRLIRRAARYGKLLGIDRPFLEKIVSTVIDSWQVEYPELKENEFYIKKVIGGEEEKFNETIHQGLNILERYIQEMNRNNKKYLDGEKAFKLYDTYGFPLDLTKEILEEEGLTVDEKEFNKYMERQREKARAAREKLTDAGWKNSKIIELNKKYNTVFKGYETLSTKSKIQAIIVDNKLVDSINENKEGMIILDVTPFYAEKGGQVADIGYIEKEGFKAKVVNTQYFKDETIVHFIRVESGTIYVGDEVVATVDSKYRKDIMRNHSATHLLHRALKDVLGEHVNQAGSLVAADRLRFDFTHYESINEQQLRQIEKKVNEKIFEQLDVLTTETSFEEAQQIGAIGLFEDKYKDRVRVVQMGQYSKELCGGTHVNNTGNIGIFKIISESSIASGIRRIEALTGRYAYEYLSNLEFDIDKISKLLKSDRKSIVSKVESLIKELKSKEKEIDLLNMKVAKSIADEILNRRQLVDGINLITYKAKNMNINSLRNLGDNLKDRLGSGLIVLATINDDKINYVAMATEDLVKKGIHAGNMIREVAKITKGGGGGRPDVAQAGGKDVTKIDEALSIIPSLIRNQLNKY